MNLGREDVYAASFWMLELIFGIVFQRRTPSIVLSPLPLKGKAEIRERQRLG